MAFLGWGDYVELLDELCWHGDDWSTATTFEEFDSAVWGKHAGLLEEHGYEDLVAGLEADLMDRDKVYEQLRISILARPAETAGLTGEEWRGCFVSTLPDGKEVYSGDRFAAPSQWTGIEVSIRRLGLEFDEETGLMYDAEHWFLTDGRTEVWEATDVPGGFRDGEGNLYVKGVIQADSAADLREQHFDAETERWRRWNAADSEFEYYDNADGVWERWREDGYWYRLHSERFGWLAYDEDSGSWLDRTLPDPAWRAHDRIGEPLPDPVTDPATTETSAELFARLPEADRLVLAELAQQVLARKPASMSDEEALGLLGRQVSARTAAFSAR